VRVVSRGVDRRACHRARLSVNVTVTLGDRIVDAASADVSSGGIRLVADQRPKLGEPVSLVFFLNGDIVCARGTVRWVSHTKHGLFAFGVRFSLLEEDAPTVVATYCEGDQLDTAQRVCGERSEPFAEGESRGSSRHGRLIFGDAENEGRSPTRLTSALSDVPISTCVTSCLFSQRRA
jgi:hypothetical protein